MLVSCPGSHCSPPSPWLSSTLHKLEVVHLPGTPDQLSTNHSRNKTDPRPGIPIGHIPICDHFQTMQTDCLFINGLNTVGLR